MTWQLDPAVVLRHEVHYGDRVLRCFADRPPHSFAMFADTVAARPGAAAIWLLLTRRFSSSQVAIGFLSRVDSSSARRASVSPSAPSSTSRRALPVIPNKLA